MLSNSVLTIALPAFLTLVAVINPILAYINGNRNSCSKMILGTGLISALAIGYLFALNYATTKFLLAIAVSHFGGI